MKKIVLVTLLLLSVASSALALCDLWDEFVPPFTAGVPGSFTFSPCCGTAPYTFSLHSGSLPAGLSLTSSGTISGTPTTAGYTTACIRMRDANGCTFVRCFEIYVD
ncbi:MAG TPA: Ig domain-containing protein [Thermoanaerobaculia bacterium]